MKKIRCPRCGWIAKRLYIRLPRKFGRRYSGVAYRCFVCGAYIEVAQGQILLVDNRKRIDGKPEGYKYRND